MGCYFSWSRAGHTVNSMNADLLSDEAHTLISSLITKTESVCRATASIQ